jgi:hypothetical protein
MLALTSPTNGICPVDIVSSRTKAMEEFFLSIMLANDLHGNISKVHLLILFLFFFQE